MNKKVKVMQITEKVSPDVFYYPLWYLLTNNIYICYLYTVFHFVVQVLHNNYILSLNYYYCKALRSIYQ